MDRVEYYAVINYVVLTLTKIKKRTWFNFGFY